MSDRLLPSQSNSRGPPSLSPNTRAREITEGFLQAGPSYGWESLKLQQRLGGARG